MIKMIGLSNHFNAITAAEDVNNGKPDPEVFLTAAKKINVNPKIALSSKTLMLELKQV